MTIRGAGTIPTILKQESRENSNTVTLCWSDKCCYLLFHQTRGAQLTQSNEVPLSHLQPSYLLSLMRSSVFNGVCVFIYMCVWGSWTENDWEWAALLDWALFIISSRFWSANVETWEKQEAINHQTEEMKEKEKVKYEECSLHESNNGTMVTLASIN